MESKQGQRAVEEVLSQFDLSKETLITVMKRMRQHCEMGLTKSNRRQSDLLMLPTFVRSLPDGSERGDFMALDLGGTNFRVLTVHINDHQIDTKSERFTMPEAVMTGTSDELFDYLAGCIAEYVHRHNLADKRIPMGFTFSFPFWSNSLDSARLLSWTKGFNIPSVVNEDVVELLKRSLKKRQDIDVEIVAVLNDTVGTIAACGFEDQSCNVGLIVGTGTNACYVERLDNVELWEGDRDHPKQMVINCEWGAFGNGGALDDIRTEYDRIVDNDSLNSGKHIYEKMISGMYLGEVCRHVMLDLVERGVLFDSTAAAVLKQRGVFETRHVSEVESDTSNNLQFVGTLLLSELKLAKVTDEDCSLVLSVCQAVSKRAARLAAAGLATLVTKVNKPQITIAVDGSLYIKHPTFKDIMEAELKNLAPQFDILLKTSSDGSGRGAALVAASVIRERQDRLINKSV